MSGADFIPGMHEWLYVDDVTQLELRVQLSGGEASVMIGPSLKAPLAAPERVIVNLLEDELIELHRALGEEIERDAAWRAVEERKINPVEPAPPIGDRVFLIQAPDTVHLFGCSLIDVSQRGMQARVQDILAFLRHHHDAITCTGCAPFGVTEVGDAWIYRHSEGGYWAAKRRLDLVADAARICVRPVRRAAEQGSDETSQPT
jgi:hypothetical protein